MSSDWTSELFETRGGRRPVEDWMDDLSSQKYAALDAAITKVLEKHGLDLMGTPWLKPLKDGLFEFRVNKTERQVLNIVNATLGTSSAVTESERILLRVFVHFHGNRIILLLGGYDKSADTNKRRQQKEIETARKRLREWQMLERAKKQPRGR